MPLTPEDRIAAVSDVGKLRAIGLSNEEIVETIRRRYRPESTGLPDTPDAQALRANHYRRVGKFGFDPFEAPLEESTRESLPEPILAFLDEALSPVGLLALAAGGPLGKGLARGGVGIGRALMSGKAGAVTVNALTDSFFYRGVMHSIGFSSPFAASEVAERVEAGEPFMAEASRVMLWSGAIDAAFGTLRLPRLLRDRAKRIAGDIANDALMAGLKRERPAVDAAVSAAGKAKITEGLTAAAAPGEAVVRAGREFAAAVDEASFLRKMERLGIPEQRIREHMLAVQANAAPEDAIIQSGEATIEGLRRMRERLRTGIVAVAERLKEKEGAEMIDAQFLGSIHTEAVIAGAEKAMSEAGFTLAQQRAVFLGATQQLTKAAGVESLEELATRFPTQARAIQLMFGRLDLADEAAAGAVHLAPKFDPRTLLHASDEFVGARALRPGDVVIPSGAQTPVTVRSIHGASGLVEAADPMGGQVIMHADDVVRRLEAAEPPGLGLPPFVRKELAGNLDELNAVRATRRAGPQARAAAAEHASPLAAEPPPSVVITKQGLGGPAPRTGFVRLGESSTGYARGFLAPLTPRGTAAAGTSLTREQRVATQLLERPEKEAARIARAKAAREAGRTEAIKMAKTELKLSDERKSSIRALESVYPVARRRGAAPPREYQDALKGMSQEIKDRGVEGRLRGFGMQPKPPVLPDRLPASTDERLMITLHNRVRELGGTGIEKSPLTRVLTSMRPGVEAAKRLREGPAAFRAVLPDTVITSDSLPSLKAALDQYTPRAPLTPGQRLRQTLDAIEGNIPGCKTPPRGGR